MDSERYIDITQFGQTSRVPIITPNLLAELMRVEPSGERSPGEYRPCEVELRDGTLRDRVYVVDAISHIFRWGFYPEESISLLNVKHIRSSPIRLPANLANKLYHGGETNMGGISFGLVLRDGRTIWAVTGNAVDFLEYPSGVSASDVVDVIHGWKDWSQSSIRNAPYSWCLYCLEPNETAAIVEAFPALNRGLITWRLAVPGSEAPKNPPFTGWKR